MIPRVEGFHAELDTAMVSFAQEKALEHREVPIITARAAKDALAEVTPGTDGRIREPGGGEELRDSARIADGAAEIRPIGSTAEAVAALGTAFSNK